jgi:hypothetical protein
MVTDLYRGRAWLEPCGALCLEVAETSAVAEALARVFGLATVHPERRWKIDP